MSKTRPAIWACIALFLIAWPASGHGESLLIDQSIDFSGRHSQAVELSAGQTIEISAGFRTPSQLPPNGRVAVEWSGPDAHSGWRKVLHALDPDVYLTYRVPRAGQYTLSLSAVENDEPAAATARWRENGALAATQSFPKHTPWPAGHHAAAHISIRTIDFGQATRGVVVEMEPNNSLAQAQALTLMAV